MRPLVALAVRRRVSVLMAALAVVAFGLVGYQRLSLDLLPDISYPSLTVQTDFPDTAPAEVENLLSRPVEEAVGVLKGLRTIHSISRPGVSEVTLEFEWGTDMDMLSMDVRERLDRLVLPMGAEAPIVLRFDPSLDPVMRYALHGSGDLTHTRRIADRRLKQELETIPGIASAQVRGGLEEEIRVDVHQDRLAALGIPIQRVRDVVGLSNVNIPGGSLESLDSRYLIRTVNEYGTLEEIGSLIVAQHDGAVVRLRDVAGVSRGVREREEITRVGGSESVEISIYREGDANTVTAARRVHGLIDQLRSELPEGYSLTLLFDQSRFIEQALREVRTAALMGGVLAILVLFAFLRHPRSTIIIAVSIPLSVIAAFMVMYRLNISLNIMSLGGLTLGIGMLVDNSIVVLESIHRRRREGASLAEAAVEGTSEVGGAVTASTLTTVAVFLPIVFVEGIAGQFFGDMALTVTLSLMASLLVAVTMIPMLSSLGSDGSRGGKRRDPADPAPAAAGPSGPSASDTSAGAPGALPGAMTLDWFSVRYDRFLRGAIRRRALTLGVAGALFAAALLAVPLIQTELVPAISEGEFFFEVNLPEGTPLPVTDRVVQRMEELTAADPGVDYCYTTVGSRLVSGGVSFNTKAEHYANINIVLKNRRDRAAEEAAADRLRRSFEEIPDLTVKLGRPSYFSLKTPVEILLFGEDMGLLQGYAAVLEEELRDVRGLVDLRSSLEEGSPELQVTFDRDRLAALGLDMRRLSEILRDRIQGTVPTRFKEEDRQIDIRIRNRQEDRATVHDVRSLVLSGSGGEPIRLLTVAEIREGRGPAEIHRVQQQRAAVLSGNLQGRPLGAVVREIRDTMMRVPPPEGVVAELGGQSDEMQVSFASLRFALALAIFLVYLVMAAAFESMLHPFIVLFTIPLALVGVVLGLLVTGTEISVIALIGTVMLVGIVVNNAIVLIDKINQLRRGGREKLDAVVEACHIRLRPILMTTLTTVLGLTPMAVAVGEGAELRAPLAITVAFGLSISTLLTLVVIPAVYMLVPSVVRARGGG